MIENRQRPVVPGYDQTALLFDFFHSADADMLCRLTHASSSSVSMG